MVLTVFKRTAYFVPYSTFCPVVVEKLIHRTESVHVTEHTHTHTKPFYSSLDFVQDNQGELVPEGTFCRFLDFLVQNEDNTGRLTNSPDRLPPHPD